MKKNYNRVVNFWITIMVISFIVAVALLMTEIILLCLRYDKKLIFSVGMCCAGFGMTSFFVSVFLPVGLNKRKEKLKEIITMSNNKPEIKKINFEVDNGSSFEDFIKKYFDAYEIVGASDEWQEGWRAAIGWCKDIIDTVCKKNNS